MAAVSLSTWFASSAMKCAFGLSCWSACTCCFTAIRRSRFGGGCGSCGFDLSFSTMTVFFSSFFGSGFFGSFFATFGGGGCFLSSSRAAASAAGAAARGIASAFFVVSRRDIEGLLLAPHAIADVGGEVVQVDAVVVDDGDLVGPTAEQEVHADRGADPEDQRRTRVALHLRTALQFRGNLSRIPREG